MNIYLSVDGLSGLGEVSWWGWMVEEFGAIHATPEKAEPDDIILRNSILGPCPTSGGIHVACLWEMYPEMSRCKVPSDEAKIAKMQACVQDSQSAVTHSTSQVDYFREYTTARIHKLTLCIDEDLFQPRHATGSGFMAMGTNHPMKDMERAIRTMQERVRSSGLSGAVIWKRDRYRRGTEDLTELADIPQVELAQMMSNAETWITANRLRSWYLVEYEAMMVGLSVLDVGNPEREHPWYTRDEMLDLGWGRQSKGRKLWANYFEHLREMHA